MDIREATWRHDGEAIRAVRRAVFTVEQGIADDLDLDGADDVCAHVLAVTGAAEPIGTGRLDPAGHIGRVAVLASWRRRGIGRGIMEALVEMARRRGLRRVDLNAQLSAVGFYERLGFVPLGMTFMEAGIPHTAMFLDLLRRP